MDEREPQTHKSAVRLLKSVLRTAVYESMGQEAMLSLEAPYSAGARREWVTTLQLWNLTTESPKVLSVVRSAFPVAANEVLALFETPWEARKVLDAFRAKFDPTSLLEGD